MIGFLIGVIMMGYGAITHDIYSLIIGGFMAVISQNQ